MNDAAIELGIDLGESVLDATIDDGLLRDIPLLGTAFNVIKISRSISDRILATKIRKFLFHLSKVTKEERTVFLENIGSEKREQISEIVLLSLNKIDNLKKTDYLAAVLAYYIGEKCSFRDFHALSHAITDCFISDLDDFITEVRALPKPYHYLSRSLNSLVSVGLTHISGAGAPKGGGWLPKPSELGFMLIKALDWYKTKAS